MSRRMVGIALFWIGAAMAACGGYMVGLERGELACDPVRDALRVGMSAAEKAIETFGEQEDKDRAETSKRTEEFWKRAQR